MTIRRPPRGRNLTEHLAEIHRLLQRNDRKMASLTRTFERLLQLLRGRLDVRSLPGRNEGSASSAESSPEF